MKIAIYARVSTNKGKQNTDNQLQLLRDYCKSMGYVITKEYIDEVSGGSGERPAFKLLFADAAKRSFDMVVFFSLDRFTREGTRPTIKYLETLESYGVGFKSYSEQYIDSSGIFKDVIISLLSTLARQEAVRQGERVLAGLARAAKAGRLGGRPKVKSILVDRITALKKEGLSNRAIGKQLKLSHTTVGLYV